MIREMTDGEWDEAADQFYAPPTEEQSFRLAEQERRDEQRRDFVAGLRQMADFLDAHPKLPAPYGSNQNTFVRTKEELAVIAREPGVRWEKSVSTDYFYLKVNFAGGHSYEVNVDRAQVCRKVVTGTRIEPAKPEQEVETFEWVCDEPLLAVTTPIAVAHEGQEHTA